MHRREKLISVIIPVLVAVLVISSLAVSGHITKNADEKNPTAETAVSLVNEDTTEETTSADSEVTIIAVGDNLIHNTLITAGEQEDGTLDYSSLYSNIKPVIEKFDISIINQETILGGDSFDYTGYPLFNSPWEIGEAAIDAGFDIFTCATNHSMDMGWSGIQKEIEFFSEHEDVVQLGVNADEDSYNQITYYQKNGITFALLNYTYGTNGISLPDDKQWCVNLLEKEKVTSDITEARKNADVVIVFPHWGTENSHEISDYQEEYTQLFCELGVDIVIGTHPHVLQDVEWVTDEESGNKTLVYYSLGNFISHQIELDQLCGGMAEIKIEKHNGEIEITTAKLVPIVCHYSKNDAGNYDFNVYKLADYTDSVAETHAQSGATAEYFTELCEEIVDEEFLSIE